MGLWWHGCRKQASIGQMSVINLRDPDSIFAGQRIDEGSANTRSMLKTRSEYGLRRTQMLESLA